MAPDGPSRFRTRFSLHSLLPSRHPPLIVSHSLPVPLPAFPCSPSSTSCPFPLPESVCFQSKPESYRTVSHHATIAVSSPVESYAAEPFSALDSSYPPTPACPPLQPPAQLAKRRSAGSGSGPGLKVKKTRAPPPPPLDLRRTQHAFPRPAVEVVRMSLPQVVELSSPIDLHRREVLMKPSIDVSSVEPEVGGTSHKKKNRQSRNWVKPKRKKDFLDPLDIVEIEPGHRYPSWKAQQRDLNQNLNLNLNLRPGDVLPRGTVDSWDRSKNSYQSGNSTLHPPFPLTDLDESVLHNVLLTPTYLHSTPTIPDAADHFLHNARSHHRNDIRNTLMDRAVSVIGKRASAWIGLRSPKRGNLKLTQSQQHVNDRFGLSDDGVEELLRKIKDRESREIELFRQHVDGDAGSGRQRGMYVSGIAGKGYWYEISPGLNRRSPGWVGEREREAGIGMEVSCGKDMKGEKEISGKERKREEEKFNKRQKMKKYIVALVIMCLVALIIGLCTSLLTRSSSTVLTSASSKTASPTASSYSTTSSPSSTALSSPSSSSTSQSLSACLTEFTSSTSSPSSYPCGTCVPLLTSTTNDFSTPLINGNSTGVGAALQFCALMDVLAGVEDKSELQGSGGWGNNTSPCVGWTGITCDERGRVTSLQLKYPSVPTSLPSSISNLISLSTFRLTGNSSIPMGSFPSSLLPLINLTIIDIEYTALTGPVASNTWSAAAGLQTLYLVNNVNLGEVVPNLSENRKLVTLAMTSQLLTNASVNTLPSSLTYMDLSYNSLSGQIPSFSQLTSLKTLLLESNSYTSPPSSLPASLSTLSFIQNTQLSGTMPQTVCSSTTLTSCDLRDTELKGTPILSANTSASISSSSQASRSVSSSSTLSSATASASVSYSCGVCLFT